MQKNYGIKFTGLGSSLPSKVVKNTDLEKLYDTSDEWIYQRTGIRERRAIKEPKETGLSLSANASKQALKSAGLKPQDIDLIIVATSTPDNLYPSMGCMLQGELNATDAVSYDLSAACSGFVFSIVTAAQFIYTGTYKNILVVGVDIHSRFLDWSERSVSILFGDGAGAVVMQRTRARDDQLIGYLISSKADKNLDLILDNLNISYDSFTKQIKSSFVRMNGKTIYEFGITIVPEVVNKLLDKVNLKIKDVDYFIPHQANERIIQASAKKLGFTERQVISNVEKVGNTSSASIPLAIADGLNSKKIKTPCKMILVGFGAGLTWGAVLIDWNIKN